MKELLNNAIKYEDVLERGYSMYDRIDKTKFNNGELHTLKRAILHEILEECMLNAQLGLNGEYEKNK